MSSKVSYKQEQEAREYLKNQSQVAEAFTNNTKTDRGLKKFYGIVLLFLLTVQLITVNVIFVLGGLKVLKYPSTTFDIFIMGSLIEVAIIVRIVVKYLFTDNISKTFNNMMRQQGNHKKY